MTQERYSEFDQIGFYNRFPFDLERAKALVLIQSPFASIRRIERLLPHLQACTKRGVQICSYVQEPEDWQRRHVESLPRLKPFEAAIEMLQAARVHVSLRKGIHEKLAIIDDEIFWDGSLNIFSHYQTSERMTRWVSRDKVQRAIIKHGLHNCDQCPASSAFRLLTGNDSAEIRREFLGRYIAATRRFLGISQRDLASRARIQQKVLSDIELGKRNVSIDTLTGIGRQLGLHFVMLPGFVLPTVQRITGRPK